MHPSEWAKAIYEKRQRKDFAVVILMLILIVLALALANWLKHGRILEAE